MRVGDGGEFNTCRKLPVEAQTQCAGAGRGDGLAIQMREGVGDDPIGFVRAENDARIHAIFFEP